MINDPNIIEKIKEEIKNLDIIELNMAIKNVEKKNEKSYFEYEANLLLSIDINAEFFNFNTYSVEKNNIIERILNLKKNNNKKEVSILEAA